MEKRGRPLGQDSGGVGGGMQVLSNPGPLPPAPPLFQPRGRSRAAASKENESADEMETSQQSVEDEEEEAEEEQQEEDEEYTTPKVRRKAGRGNRR
ncbi:hypothetical protein ANANG_G00240110 [Anguilla anguilla]|uniref:Uncharacterized protein n=1 Tax=Anguilla anguilla TaxID=7936 RepID=A0A9D3LV13_ANGAN|nr:hypothetical protein ANANG_G00240110 [Anguilla anguilla]